MRTLTLVIACAIAGGVGARLALGSSPDAMPVVTSAESPAPTTAPEPATTVEVAAEAGALLEGRKSDLMEVCGTHASGAPVGSIVVSFDLGFDASGQLRAWGVSGGRDVAAEALAGCLRDQTLPLEVTPAGVPVTISVPVAFP